MAELIKVYDTRKVLLKEGTKYEIFKQYSEEIREVDAEDRTVIHLITTDTRDRYGDIVEPKGGQIENFLRDPVVLDGHKYGTFPVGTNVWLKKNKGGILAKTRFHDKTQIAIDAFNLVAEGILRAWSIGFMPINWETFEEDGTRGYLYKIWELLEYSLVTVPANPDALTMALQKGWLVDPVWEKIIEKCELSGSQNSLVDAERLTVLGKRIDDVEGRIVVLEDYGVSLRAETIEEANKKANESLEIIVDRIPEIVSESIDGVVRRITGQTSKEK